MADYGLRIIRNLILNFMHSVSSVIILLTAKFLCYTYSYIQLVSSQDYRPFYRFFNICQSKFLLKVGDVNLMISHCVISDDLLVTGRRDGKVIFCRLKYYIWMLSYHKTAEDNSKISSTFGTINIMNSQLVSLSLHGISFMCVHSTTILF